MQEKLEQEDAVTKSIRSDRLPNSGQNPTPCKDAIIVIVLLLAALVLAFPIG